MSPRQYVQTLSKFLEYQGEEAHFEQQTAAMVPFSGWTHIPQYVSLVSTVEDWNDLGSAAQRLQNLVSERKDSGSAELLQFRRVGGRLVIFNSRLTGRSGDSGEAERVFRREAERNSGMIPNTIGA